MRTKKWNVEIVITESDRTTVAEARLRGQNAEVFVGEGTAHRKRADQDIPHIGDELAVARALSGVSHGLLHEVAAEIETRTGERVPRLRG
ncbi:dsRBD fold-containing protein [Streptomyces sp. NPDC127084]|uniref:dsRBD fold-containing protein n=1 Tax=Streptomyces sp. NPDC127084 TaxID=3347133 RepID=UPI00366231DF